MIKDCLINFFKRFKYYFICFGLILLGILVAIGIFYAGMTITINVLDEDISQDMYEYLLSSFKSIKPEDIISLSFISKIYHGFIDVADDNAFNFKIGITLSAIASVFVIYGAYKGSSGLVNYLNKRQLRNEETKHGFVPFIIKLIIALAFATILLVLLHLWKFSFIFVLLIYLLIDSFESIVSIKYIYFPNVKLKEFLISKDFFKVMGIFLIFQYVLFMIASSLWFITPWLSILIMVPMLAYSETNIEYTIITTFKKNEE